MASPGEIERIVRLYPDGLQPQAIEPVTSTNSFSGAGLWRIQSTAGSLCLRRWPAGHPNQQRLEFIQAVLWHVHQEGFKRLPLPMETQHRHGYVWHAGHLWELTPWLSGAPDYRQHPNLTRLYNAMVALAQFHVAAATFPLPDAGPGRSPGIAERLERLQKLLSGGVAPLVEWMSAGRWPEFDARAERIVSLFLAAAPAAVGMLESAAGKLVAWQPCIRDIWHPHVLFEGNEVSGLVDFGSLRTENVAADVARLLGSLASDDAAHWRSGLAAYQAFRPLSADELELVTAFDRSTVLMGGIQWLEWVYIEQRTFAHPAAVLARLDEFLARLENLSQTIA